jgi:excisionase family DNA binding protein
MARKFTTASEAAERFGVTVRYVQRLCKEGKIKGAQQFGSAWMVPATFKWKPGKPGPKKAKRAK